MINVTRLYCGAATGGDSLRYGEKAAAPGHGAWPGRSPVAAAQRRPVTVWGATRTCNLSCVHCYSDSYNRKYEGELVFDPRDLVGRERSLRAEQIAERERPEHMDSVHLDGSRE